MRHASARKLIVLTIAGCATVSATAAETSLVGTLTCTGEVAKSSGATPQDWRISCAFEPAKGKIQHYSGSIADPGPEPRAAGKAFLVWSVFAAVPEVGSGMLVGTYKETKPGGGSLVGGRDQAILLQPLGEPARQGGVNIASRVSAVRLELPKV